MSADAGNKLGATDGPPQDCSGLPRGTCSEFPFDDETVQSDEWLDYTAADFDHNNRVDLIDASLLTAQMTGP